MRILLVAPSLKLIGGVALHYKGLHPYWRARVRYATLGHRAGLHSIFWLLPDYVVFLFHLLTFRPSVVVLNPSLSAYMVARECVYIVLSRLFRRPVVCFFHGWRLPFAARLEGSPRMLRLFRFFYRRVSLFYVLSGAYRDQLVRMGIPAERVQLNTTKVDDRLLEGFSMESRYRPAENLLFLSRVARTKGIFEAIDAFVLLKKEFPRLRFTIVGNGSEEQEARRYVSDHGVPDVRFLGPLSGSDLARAFAEGDIYILPTYFEGMATSVLEAMAFGLPVVTAPVGGVCDFFREGEMGFLPEGYAPAAYAEAVARILRSDALRRRMGETNYRYAQQHFLASDIAARMECDFFALLSARR